MANKALLTRQKLHFRVEASQKPRKQLAGAAPHVKNASALRLAARRTMKKAGPERKS